MKRYRSAGDFALRRFLQYQSPSLQVSVPPVSGLYIQANLYTISVAHANRSAQNLRPNIYLTESISGRGF